MNSGNFMLLKIQVVVNRNYRLTNRIHELSLAKFFSDELTLGELHFVLVLVTFCEKK